MQATYKVLWIHHDIWKDMVSQDLHPDPCFHKDVTNWGSMLQAKSTVKPLSLLGVVYSFQDSASQNQSLNFQQKIFCKGELCGLVLGFVICFGLGCFFACTQAAKKAKQFDT